MLATSSLICKGLAKRHGLKVSGRRNSYGCFRGKRSGQWQSGCKVAFASQFRSNTHSMPGYRVPPTKATHEDACPSKLCRRHFDKAEDEAKTIKTIAKRAQRVQRECTGYYCGYTFKTQPVGRKYVKAAQQSLNYLTAGLEDKSDGQKWHRVTQRILVDLNHRCTSRPVVEEWNLAVYGSEQDVTNAEFIRTFRSETFPGGLLVTRLEEEMRNSSSSIRKIIPPSKAKQASADELFLKHFPDLYGFRATPSTNRSVYYLNPWEFVSLWEVRRLPPPSTGASEKPSLTVLDASDDSCVLNKAAVKYYRHSKDVLFYPETPGGVNLRNLWYMVRRKRPMVPSPAQTPMPDKYVDAEQKAKLYSVYLRPWVLDHCCATLAIVPHITMLNSPDRRRLRGKQAVPLEQTRLSYAEAWRAYIRGHVVSRHAQRIIVQFMAACCGKSKKADDEEEKAERLQMQAPPNDLQLARVHALLDAPGDVPKKKSLPLRPSSSEVEKNLEGDDEAAGVSAEVLAGMHAVDKLWQRDKGAWLLEDIPSENQKNSRLRAHVPDSVEAKKSSTKGGERSSRGQSRAYIELTQQKVQEWWKKVHSSKKPPSPDKEAFLKDVIARCEVEKRELARWQSSGFGRKPSMFI